jgi:hypothetical protein
MTKLTGDKPITRETAVQERGRALVVTLHPRTIVVRLKGLRDAYTLDYETLLAFTRRRDFEFAKRHGYKP